MGMMTSQFLCIDDSDGNALEILEYPLTAV